MPDHQPSPEQPAGRTAKEIEWYIDFLSPFPYLQLPGLAKLPPNVVLRPKPVLFAALLDHWGNKGPAEIPAKRRFTFRHVQWRAGRLGIPFRFPPLHPFNPLKPLRLAIALGCGQSVVETIMKFIWAEGRDTDNPAHWRELCERLHVADGDEAIADPGVKSALRRNCEEAIARGVFGVPSCIVDGELFWGADATEMLLDYLAAPSLLRSDEMLRVSDLPAGIQRRT